MRLFAFGFTALLAGDSLRLWAEHTVTPVTGIVLRLGLGAVTAICWVLSCL